MNKLIVVDVEVLCRHSS